MSRIVRIGTSHGIVIPAATLEAANLRPGEEVELHPVQDGVVIVAADSPSGKALAATLKSFEDHAGVYRKLAE